MCADKQPASAHARFVESVARLTLGDFGAGWVPTSRAGRSAGSRRDSEVLQRPFGSAGESLAAETILLHAEQGLGDTIHFARYAPVLAARGAEVVPKRFSRSLCGSWRACRALPGGRSQSTVTALRLSLSAAQLAARLRNDVRDDSGECPLYIAGRCRPRIVARPTSPPDPRHRVGLVWSGERSHDNDLNRSMRLETLATVLDLPGISSCFR